MTLAVMLENGSDVVLFLGSGLTFLVVLFVWGEVRARRLGTGNTGTRWRQRAVDPSDGATRDQPSVGRRRTAATRFYAAGCCLLIAAVAVSQLVPSVGRSGIWQLGVVLVAAVAAASALAVAARRMRNR